MFRGCSGCASSVSPVPCAIVLACAPAAHARPVDLGPVAHASNLPAKIKVKVAPGGTASISSPELSPTMKSMAVDVTPSSPADERFFNRLSSIVAAASSLKKRVLLCIGMYSEALADTETFDRDVDIRTAPYGVELLLLSMCLNVAVQLSRPQEAAATAVGAGRTVPAGRSPDQGDVSSAPEAAATQVP